MDIIGMNGNREIVLRHEALSGWRPGSLSGIDPGDMESMLRT